MAGRRADDCWMMAVKAARAAWWWPRQWALMAWSHRDVVSDAWAAVGWAQWMAVWRAAVLWAAAAVRWGMRMMARRMMAVRMMARWVGLGVVIGIADGGLTWGIWVC